MTEQPKDGGAAFDLASAARRDLSRRKVNEAFKEQGATQVLMWLADAMILAREATQ